MCGIAGIIEFQAPLISQEEFDPFLDSISHRGPDGRGVHCEKGVFIGHRRLTILDLSQNASQPMADSSGRYWITFNGEIYNFLELRRELGGYFRTESDTEVILEAYKKWGPQCQLRFNGMWSFAIWDSWERKLFISRYRFGVKPLYYYQVAIERAGFCTNGQAARALTCRAANFRERAAFRYAQPFGGGSATSGANDRGFAGAHSGRTGETIAPHARAATAPGRNPSSAKTFRVG